MKAKHISFAVAATLLAGSAMAAGNAVGEIPHYPAALSDNVVTHEVIANTGSPQPIAQNIVGEIPNYPGAIEVRMVGPTNVVARDVPDSVVGAIPNYPGEVRTASNVGSRG